MPSYKLTYFPVRGRAEPIRLMFAAAGVKYEDNRITFQEFSKLKESGKLPFGQLPILEVDGKILAQTTAILKYVASLGGFSPGDHFERAQADMVVYCLVDIFAKLTQFFMEKDEEKKKPLMEEFFDKHLPASLGHLEKIAKSNNGHNYFVGKKLTYADVLFFSSIEAFCNERKEDASSLLKVYPQLKVIFDNVKCTPGIKKWLNERPVTDK